MATLTVALPPSDGTPITFTTTLSGTLYQGRIAYNARCLYGTLDLADASGEPIITGLRCIADLSLLAHVSHESKPPGILLLVDAAGTSLDPGLFDIGNRVKLVYIEPDDD